MKTGWWKSWLLSNKNNKKGGGDNEPQQQDDDLSAALFASGRDMSEEEGPVSLVPEEEIMAQYPPVRCLRNSSFPQEEVALQNNFVTHPLPLPRELAPLVLGCLSAKDLVLAGSTCRLWYSLTSADHLWARFLESTAGRTEGHTYKELFLDLQLEEKRRAIRRHNAVQRQNAWRRSAACGMRGWPEPLAPRPKLKSMGFEPSPAWPVHPNSSNELTIKLGFDLVKSAKELVSFSRDECTDDIYRDPEFLEWALWRYTRFMQLKAQHPGRFLVPTTEIEFVWQSHLLRPMDYARDVKHVWRVEGDDVMDHRLLGSEADYLLFDEALRETAQLWHHSYGEEYCKIPDAPVREKMPIFRDQMLSCTVQEKGTKKLWFETRFDPRMDVPAGWTPPPAGWTSPISLKVEDLVKDTKWFEYFSQENSRSSYGFYPEKGWYNLAAKAYERFLYFCYMEVSEELAHPTYAIDLMWHTHMLHPKLYREDMVRLTGRMVEHLPWPEHYEEANFTRTNDVWQREFGIPIQEETRKGPWRDNNSHDNDDSLDLYM